jgi:hypothetical protein
MACGSRLLVPLLLLLLLLVLGPGAAPTARAAAPRADAAPPPDARRARPAYPLDRGPAQQLFEVLGAEEPLQREDVERLIQQLRCGGGTRAACVRDPPRRAAPRPQRQRGRPGARARGCGRPAAAAGAPGAKAARGPAAPHS